MCETCTQTHTRVCVTHTHRHIHGEERDLVATSEGQKKKVKFWEKIVLTKTSPALRSIRTIKKKEKGKKSSTTVQGT